MSGIAAIGCRARVAGFALAGVEVYPATEPEQVLAAWRNLAPEVAVVILTPEAAEILGDSETRLIAVLPP